jgi:hypothetical protein
MKEKMKTEALFAEMGNIVWGKKLLCDLKNSKIIISAKRASAR